MSLDNFKPAFWAATVMRTLEDNLIAKKICTQEYTGEIKKAGDTVYFNGLADPTISDYTGAALTYEALQDASLKLVVDQQKSYSFLVDDIDAAQANVNLKSSQIKRAAYLLQRSVDSFIFGLYAQAQANAAAITDATCDTATIIGDIGLLWQYLSENNVPEGQMWCVIPPWVKLKLMEAGIKFSINEGINGSGGMSWAKGELGFDIYVSNLVYNSGTAAAPVSSVLAGSYNAIGFADQILKSEAFRHQSYFADAARGLYTYGAKVLKPKELALATLTYTAETAI
jgi:hypothetical protein